MTSKRYKYLCLRAEHFCLVTKKQQYLLELQLNSSFTADNSLLASN